MFEVKLLKFEDLTESEQDHVSNNGSGKEYAGYIKVILNGETVLFESDAMEPEDATFSRDLSWVKEIIEKSYEFGKADQGGATMKKKLLNTLATSTRDAVESSIDLSKGDKSITWEEIANKRLTKIARWESKKNQSAASQ